MWPEDPAGIRPMLASTTEVSLTSTAYAYEPKYDGIRAIIALEPAPQPRSGPKQPARARIWSRQGNDKTGQFPDVVAALGKAFAGLARSVLLDGEIVAVDASGAPTTFLRLQGRMHRVVAHDGPGPSSVAFIAFDILIDGDRDLRQRPLTERRTHLERVMSGHTGAAVRLSEHVVGDGRPLQRRAHDDNWEGLIAKRLESRYVSGKRSTDWCKVKLVRQQTCVIGGWTPPKGVRQRFGALLLGVYDEQGQLQHAGQVGTGFSSAELERVWHLLVPLSTERSPFLQVPRELARARWVKPELVCEVKFAEWTLDGKLRHPAYLGMRDDVDARRVKKEPQTGATAKARTRARAPGRARTRPRAVSSDLQRMYGEIITQVDAIQAGNGSGRLDLPDGGLDVTNLGKVFWPQLKLSKGDLFRHYLRVGAAILPALADRPLVMKRYPGGVDAKPFYQHRAADRLPAGVVVANVESKDGTRPHVIGGSLLSLLYTSQLAAISQDPWFSRLGSLDHVDAIAIDLDPPDGLPFRRVLDIALRVRDELAALGAEAFAKTSGARGVHVFVPMPAGTPYEAALLYAQIVATMVARRHPQHATVERTVAARGQRIYLDYLQNMRGKTLASAYSVRANAWAGVSTPLRWEEVEAGVSATDFTIQTIGARLDAVGDIWSGLREATPADLRAVMRYAEP